MTLPRVTCDEMTALAGLPEYVALEGRYGEPG